MQRQTVSADEQAGAGVPRCEYRLRRYSKLTRQMYDEAMGGIKKHLIGQTKRSGLIFTQELHPGVHPRDKTQCVLGALREINC